MNIPVIFRPYSIRNLLGDIVGVCTNIYLPNQLLLTPKLEQFEDLVPSVIQSACSGGNQMPDSYCLPVHNVGTNFLWW